MGLFSKKKQSVGLADPATEGAAATPAASVPPAPPATELDSTAGPETTTTQAEKADTKSRTEQQAARARTECAAAKTHLKNTCKECRSGICASARAARLLPYCLMERLPGKDGRKAGNDEAAA